MAEVCPARTTLEAFAAATPAERQRDDLEEHLTHCLRCAEEIDKLTRAQLARLIGNGPATVAVPPAASPVLHGIMRQAADGVGTLSLIDTDSILAVLDAPTADGALGAFAGYDIMEIEGRGGMGVVFKGRDRTLDRCVAIKVLLPVGFADGDFVARFLEEARAVAAIQHDHIVAVHHAGVAKGLPYLVMPFHTEGTLEQILAGTPTLPPLQVARFGLQLARALTATHARGILHRDIKPSNVLLEDGGMRVRLADFGLAQTNPLNPRLTSDPVDGGTRPVKRNMNGIDSRTIAGTPHYMSPEQARGEAIDARSDLFSLGAVLFQMATGRPLYGNKSSKEVLAAAACCDFRRVREAAPELPPALAGIIDRLLARRADDRFSSAAEIVSELEGFIEAKPWIQRWMKGAVVGALTACLASSAIVLGLDATGTTAFINSWLCQRSGDGYYVRGRFGTFSHLPEAVAAARPHDIIEARFSDERLVGSFRVGGKALTIRAARGFAPILIATNNAQPLMLVDAPLSLEGLTLWRRGPVVNFAALVSVENAPLYMLNCRVLRSGHQGQAVLVWGRLRPTDANKPLPYRALLAFQHGSVGYVRNSLVFGTPATAFELRASASEPTSINTDNSLFVIDRGFHLNREVETGVTLSSRNCVYLNTFLLDIDRAELTPGISVSWQDCFVDRTQGAIIRLDRYGDGTRLRALEWSETNVVYFGRGAYLAEQDRDRIVSEVEWNELLQPGAGAHQLSDRQAFAATCVRSSLTLSAIDLDPQFVRAGDRTRPVLELGFVGEGKPYEAFREDSAYEAWQKQVKTSMSEWEERRAAPPPMAAR